MKKLTKKSRTNLTARIIIEPEAKKLKREPYELEAEVEKFVSQDTANRRIWDECRESMGRRKISFLQTVAERFTCVCCRDVVHNPVTTTSAHNMCRNCLKRRFRAGVHGCPTCRRPMRKNREKLANESLSSALKLLFPGYGGGR